MHLQNENQTYMNGFVDTINLTSARFLWELCGYSYTVYNIHSLDLQHSMLIFMLHFLLFFPISFVLIGNVFFYSVSASFRSIFVGATFFPFSFINFSIWNLLFVRSYIFLSIPTKFLLALLRRENKINKMNILIDEKTIFIFLFLKKMVSFVMSPLHLIK